MTQPQRSVFLAFFREARRRKVYISAVTYLVITFALVQGAEVIFDALLLPDWSIRLLTILLILGFPIVVVLAWIFDIGPQGLRRTESLDPPESRTPTVANSAAPSLSHSDVRRVAVSPPRPLTPSPPRSVAAPEPEPALPPDPDRVRRASLGHVRHELRTPINAIIGYGEMLLEDAQDSGDDVGANDLRQIQSAGRELLSLVDTILAPERIEKESDLDLASYAEQIRADLRDPINAVIGYAELLVESGRTDLASDLERIRTAAFRLLDMSTDIVQVATLSGAEVPGKRFTEAAVIAEGVLSKLRPIEGTQEERQGSLLVIDDNATNRDLLSRQFARKGYLVATAEGGAQGLRRLEEDEFDLVLLDIMMPEIDGIEVLRRIKAQPRLRDVPVIMISSLDEIDGAIRCIESGAADYVTRPFHPTLLDARIGAALEMRRLRERERAYRSQLESEGSLERRVVLGALPASIAERLRSGERGVLETYAQATVAVCDLERAARGGARADVADRAARFEWLLGILEEAARTHELGTVLLQGPTVVLAAGVPAPAPDHAERVALATLTALERARAQPHGGDVALRFGLHSGAAVGGIIGGERLSYQLWGDAVDLARRLEAQAEPASVHASPASHSLLKDRFAFASRGVIEVTGRGQMRTFTLQHPILQQAGR